MARPLRIQFENAYYHVTGRGNARQAIFADDADRAAFPSLLKVVKGTFFLSELAILGGDRLI